MKTYVIESLKLPILILSVVSIFSKIESGILPSSRSGHDIKAHLEMHSVVPDVLREAPKEAVMVTYLGGIIVDLGKLMYPQQVKFMPYSVIWPTEKDAYYTLIMTGPDNPSRKKHKQREFQHWVVGNIPETGVLAGKCLSDYFPPSPFKGSGLHRYVFVVFKQPNGKINFTERFIPSEQPDYRGRFRTMRFADKYGLGEPIAANLFQAEWTPPEAMTEPDITTLWIGTFPPSTRFPRPIDVGFTDKPANASSEKPQ